MLLYFRAKRRTVLLVPFIALVSLSILNIIGCATISGSDIETENPYREHQTIYAPTSLAKNLVALPGGGIAIPPGWRASYTPTGNDTSVAVTLRNADDSVSGRYEIVDIKTAGVSRDQARFLYEHSFSEGWTVDGRFTIGTEGGPLLMIRATDGSRTRIGFFRDVETTVYITEFILNTGAVESDEMFVQELYDYVIAGKSVSGHYATARLRDSGVSFFGVHSGFRWVADTAAGVILAGRAENADVVFEIDHAESARITGERGVLPTPLVRHRLFGNQAALMTITHAGPYNDGTRHFGTIEIAPDGGGQRFDIVLTVTSSDDKPLPPIDTVLDSSPVVALVQDELIVTRR